jgi:hypothetical protein
MEVLYSRIGTSGISGSNKDEPLGDNGAGMGSACFILGDGTLLEPKKYTNLVIKSSRTYIKRNYQLLLHMLKI